MKEIVVWTHGYHFQNTRSFLFPLILFKKYFESKGLRISIFNKPHISKKKSILFIESNFFGKKLLTDHDEVIRLLKTAKKEFSKVIYFDLSDSTSLLHPQIIKYVDIYSKSQLLKDKNLYKKRYYGNRIYTDFVFRKYKIIDEVKSYSFSINEKLIKKLRIHWNSSIGNYTYIGRILDKLYEKSKFRMFLRTPVKPQIFKKKKKDLFYNMNVKYSRKTVSWYREAAFKNLNLEVPKRIKIYKYFIELEKSKVSLSPFGWGEINYRDFESFIYCSLLLKPNMSHLETWPNLYQDKNYISYSWNGNDLMEKLKKIKKNYPYYSKIAQNGHDFYFNQLQNENLKKNIYKRLLNLIS